MVVAALAAVLTLPGGSAAANDHLQTFVSIDAAAGEFPEGVAFDRTGTLYVSLLGGVQEVRRVEPDGAQSIVTTFDVPGFGPAGLAVDARGTVYAAVVTFDEMTQGVYRIGRDGTVQRLPGTQAMVFPNDVRLDDRGNVYATDTVGGAVWRIPRGGEAELWIQHPLLAGTNEFEEVDFPVGTDGIALDVHGDIYAGVGVQNTVIRVTRDGVINTLATASDGLNQPSTLAFGTGRAQHQTVYVANFSLLADDPTPAILTLPVGTPGQPMP